MKKLILLILNFITFQPIFSEYTLGITAGKNNGEHIFETGNKYPNLSGIRGGSRITYNRDFEDMGLAGGYFKNRWAFIGNFSSTGWSQKTNKGSRDEDFLMGSISTEKGTKFSLNPLFLYDTAHTFSGTQNFADGHAKSTVNQVKTEFFTRYYLCSNSSPWERQNSFFFSVGLRHTYFKYVLYDVIQYVNRPAFYGPIGLGLSFSYASLEFPFGLGYSFKYNKWRLEPSFHLLFGFNRYRDFHVQRALNFIGKGLGNGFLYNIDIAYTLSEKDLIKFSFQGHRFFSYTTFVTTGGLTQEDILSTYAGNFRSYVTTKESLLQISYERRLGYQHTESAINPEPEKKPEEKKENPNE